MRKKITQQEFDELYRRRKMLMKITRQVQPIYLQCVDFRGIKFPENADLREADFFNSDFSNCDLSGAFFVESNLNNAIFAGANLSMAVIRETKMRRTNLAGANLTDTLFMGTSLKEVNHSNVFSMPNGNCIWTPSENGVMVYGSFFDGTVDEKFFSGTVDEFEKKYIGNEKIKMLREIEKGLQK